MPSLVGFDVNTVVAGVLRDMAQVQTSAPRKWGYKQAANAIRWLDVPVAALVQPDGTLQKIPRIGPATSRIIFDVLQHGRSDVVERTIDESGQRADIERRRAWRVNFLSRAAATEVLRRPEALSETAYRGDLQMHSTWSDGSQSLQEIIEGGLARGYAYAAVTDHSAGLPVAGGLSLERLAAQAAEIADLNAAYRGRFHLLRGIEANIRTTGDVDVDIIDRQRLDIVVAAPHSALRSPAMQTDRMLQAVTSPGVHILGHPRGRMYSSRPGVSADWPRVFEAAARSRVAIELDGDPSRQDLDFDLARLARDAGCLFALDSDAHAVSELAYVDLARAHATLAEIPAERIVNYWSLEHLLEWAHERRANR